MNLRCLMRHFHRMIRNFQMMSCLLRRTGLICRTDLIRLTILNRRMRLIRLWSLNCPQAVSYTHLKALTDVYDRIFEYDLSNNTMKCLDSHNSAIFKWLENIPMQIDEANEKWISSIVAEEDRSKVRNFFEAFRLSLIHILSTVAIYSEADRNALHVALADQSYCIGGPEACLLYTSIPLYSNVTARLYDGDVAGMLSRQIASPVQWEKIIRNMIADGFDTFIEIGPGRTLTNIIKKTDPSVRAVTAAEYMGSCQEGTSC